MFSCLSVYFATCMTSLFILLFFIAGCRVANQKSLMITINVSVDMWQLDEALSLSEGTVHLNWLVNNSLYGHCYWLQ